MTRQFVKDFVYDIVIIACGILLYDFLHAALMRAGI